MNYTANHHLPQWSESDRVRMQDFNQMCQDLEAALNEKPYIIGSYTGDGKSQIIELPFRPSMVIVSGILDNTDPNSTENIHYIAVSCSETNIRRRLQILNRGFVVYPAGNYDRQTPNLNVEGRYYDYIAFR